jgi:hypothetical protein
MRIASLPFGAAVPLDKSEGAVKSDIPCSAEYRLLCQRA